MIGMKNKDDILYSIKYLKRLINRIDENTNQNIISRYSEVSVQSTAINNLDIKLERKILLSEYRNHLFNEYKVLRKILKQEEIDITTSTVLVNVDSKIIDKFNKYQETLSLILCL